jgi:hypothetical protein
LTARKSRLIFRKIIQLKMHFFIAPARPIAYNVPAAWRSWGSTAQKFGQSPTVKGQAEIRAITSTPISPNRLLSAGIFPFLFFTSFSKARLVNAEF